MAITAHVNGYAMIHIVSHAQDAITITMARAPRDESNTMMIDAAMTPTMPQSINVNARLKSSPN